MSLWLSCAAQPTGLFVSFRRVRAALFVQACADSADATAALRLRQEMEAAGVRGRRPLCQEAASRSHRMVVAGASLWTFACSWCCVAAFRQVPRDAHVDASTTTALVRGGELERAAELLAAWQSERWETLRWAQRLREPEPDLLPIPVAACVAAVLETRRPLALHGGPRGAACSASVTLWRRAAGRRVSAGTCR